MSEKKTKKCPKLKLLGDFGQNGVFLHAHQILTARKQ